MQSNVLEWLEYSAKDKPEKIALLDEYEQLTFKEYHDKSLGIAEAIIKMGYGRKRPVVVYMEKSVKILVSFMGVAYSGNFYSPVDTEMPAARVNKILEVLRPELVITTKELEDVFKAFHYNGRFLLYEETGEKEDSEEVRSAMNAIVDTDLLYV